MTSHVFVSHASTDKEVVLKLREALEPGVRLWIDNREMVGGDDLDAEILAAIDDARHVILVRSSRSSARVRICTENTRRSSPSCGGSSTARAIRRWRRIRGFITGMPSR